MITRKMPVRAIALASTIFVSPAFAQTETAPAADPVAAESTDAAGGVEDIVVTAQRRSESLQKVPVAVTAITAANLAKTGLNSTEQLGAATPGLMMTTQRSTVTPYLRGVGTQNGGVGEEGSIATYIDGIYSPALAGATFSFNNIERVEVLKGPQGTLFGRNATGGLIHVITKDPSHTTLVDANIGYANYDTWSGGVYGTTGLSDTVAMDIAGFFTHQGDGWGKDISGVAGVDGKDVNRRREWALRSKILFEPTDDLRITVAGDYNKRLSDVGTVRQVLPGAVLTGGTTFKGGLYDTQANFLGEHNLRQWGVSLKAEYDMGWATLTSTTGYRNVDNQDDLDQDGGPLTYVSAPITEKTKSLQQEFLLVGKTDRLDWTVGTFLFYSKAQFDPLALRSALPVGTPGKSIYDTQNRDRFSTQKTYSYAAFVQGTYHVTDTTGLTAGLRYTSDKRKIEGQDIAVAGNTLGAPGTVLASIKDQETFDKLTWRLALDQQVTDNVLAYASYSRGFKSGIYNNTNPYQAPVRPETLDAFEVGFKSDLLDRRLRFNASAFLYKYKDIQLTRIVAATTELFNAAKAEVKGFEIEAVAVPPVPEGNLEFRAGFSYLHGEYTSFPNAPLSSRNPAGGNVTTPGDASGNEMVRTPPYSLTLSGDYTIPVGSVDLGLNLSYYYNSGFYWDPDNRVKQKDYNLLNAQVSLSGQDQPWRVSAFVRNITKAKYYNQVSSGAFGDQFSAGAPRTYGVTLGYKFGG